MNAHDLKLDHFKFYNFELMSRQKRHRVLLQGQFDKYPEKAIVTKLRMFANPVSKNGEKIYDPNAHLTMYQLRVAPWYLDSKRDIVTESQFGKHSFTIGDEFALLAPAKKYEVGLRFPKKLDHYKVYKVEPQLYLAEDKKDPLYLGKDVKLKDQFSTVEARINSLVAFAVPVYKEHDGRSFEVYNEKAHLLIYECYSHHVGRQRRVSDQFGKYKLYFGRGKFLGVPCLKLSWQERGDRPSLNEPRMQ